MRDEFSYHVTKFFGEFLPMQLGASANTVAAYRDTFVQLIGYMEANEGIKANRLGITDITADAVEGFLAYLEQGRGVCVSTRNLRLASIHSFFKYVQRHDLKYFSQCASVLTIPFKKTTKEPMTYLSVEEVQALLALPDAKTRKGIRGLAIVATLYETAARVQEVIDLAPHQVRLDGRPTIELHGKGGKVRLAPIGGGLVPILGKYFSAYAISDASPTVFFNNQGKRMTRAGIQYVVDKFVSAAKEVCPSIKGKNVTNHTFRHSKAMHLLEAGVNLVYIRDFLGHSSVTTTEIYARANPELKRKYIEQSATALNTGKSYSDNDKQDLINWLKKSL